MPILRVEIQCATRYGTVPAEEPFREGGFGISLAGRRDGRIRPRKSNWDQRRDAVHLADAGRDTRREDARSLFPGVDFSTHPTG